VLVLPQRNPVVLAKQAATEDVLSGGRLVLGIGSGWLAEEFAALGAGFDDRGDRTDEAIAVLRELWSDGTATHHGRHFDFEGVYSRPRPLRGTIPIVVGGHSRRAARRAGELGDGFFPNDRSVDVVRDLIVHARHCAERAGRDPGALEITVGSKPTAEDVGRWMELGVDRIVIGNVGPDGLRIFGEQVVAPLR
jgi:probable F420-dependent oxidoreductase